MRLMLDHFLMRPVRKRNHNDRIDVMHVDAADVTSWERVVQQRDVPELAPLGVRLPLNVAKTLFLSDHDYGITKAVDP